MKHASFLRTRRHKASVAAAFVILIGVTLLCVLYQLKASRNLTLASEQSVEASPSMVTLVHEHSAEDDPSMVKSLVDEQHTEPWRPQSHLDHSVEDLSGVDPVAMDAADQREETLQSQVGFKGLENELQHRPRVFDVILLNDELDILEIRLNELHSAVDVFFIMEAPYTFSGKPKPLYFRDNETRFRQFRDKIVHVTIPRLSPEDEAQYLHHGVWANEQFSRNRGLKIATDTRKPSEGDWILLSDLDEIPRRSFLETLKAPDPDTEIGRRLLEGFPESDGDVFKLGCRFYYYSYEYRHRGDWYGPALLRYRDPDSPIFTRPESDPYPHLDKIQHITEDDWSDAGFRLRCLAIKDTPYFDDQCFHCSWCFSNITQVTSKMKSYSHKEHNQRRYANRKWILDHFSQGIDLFDRDGEHYDYIEDNQDLPQYIRDNSARFSFLLRRKGLPNAGFIDVDPMNALSG